jgi:hypothetical protein
MGLQVWLVVGVDHSLISCVGDVVVEPITQILIRKLGLDLLQLGLGGWTQWWGRWEVDMEFGELDQWRDGSWQEIDTELGELDQQWDVWGRWWEICQCHLSNCGCHQLILHKLGVRVHLPGSQKVACNRAVVHRDQSCRIRGKGHPMG